MNSPRRAFFPSPGLTWLLLLVTPYAPARAQASLPPTPQTTYVYFQRTSGHVKFSTPQAFQKVVNEIWEVETSAGGGISSRNAARDALQKLLRRSGNLECYCAMSF
jgi:hypothetical protein